MVKFVLILMVRNESKIIERCLNSVEGVVDAICVTDTGSTDSTCEIVNKYLDTHNGSLHTCEWRNFGYNRTISFMNAKEQLKAIGCDLSTTYGLLLDADMVFVPGALKEMNLTEPAYKIIQKAGSLEYPNTRLIRMDQDVICKGVTHEYWDIPSSMLKCSHINDLNDGGCKSDKFERDAALLEDGLFEDPDNERYLFYLGQTYHSLRRHEDSIDMYIRRIEAGGWYEEVWYSHYMIAQCYRDLNKPIEFEHWVLKAYEYRPVRSEALYILAKYFREKGQFYKAQHYVDLGKKIPLPQDSLFIERDVYDSLFAYEETILTFYTQKEETDGLERSMRYLLTSNPFQDVVLSNMKFYIKHIGSVSVYPVIHDSCGENFHPSSVSTLGSIHNVRFVNYSINHYDGTYTMKDGVYKADEPVRTKNMVMIGGEGVIMDDDIGLPKTPSRIKGLEDIRLYRSSAGVMCFTATSAEYSSTIRIIRGIYDVEKTCYRNCVLMESPTNQECEKNWIPIDTTDDVVYRWHPLEIGSFEGNQLKIHTRIKTPWFFKHLRGSAVPMKVNSELWFLTHFVEYTSPRKYFHCFVVLSADYTVKRISLPFVFRKKQIEYCLSTRCVEGTISCIVSTFDDNPIVVSFATNELSWITCTDDAKIRSQFCQCPITDV
jgi:glycosyltransferase involved in cell wall biosynthesis